MENYQDVLLQMEQFGIELRDRDLPLKLDKGKRVTCGQGGKAWYKLFLFSPKNSSIQFITGTFGTYRNGGDWAKVENDWAPLSEEERARMKAEREVKKAAAAVERALEIANASADALTIWRKGVAAMTCPCLEKKGVKGETFRVLDKQLVQRWPAMKKDEDETVWVMPAGTLLLPLMRYDLPRNVAMRGLQFIKPDGGKIYLRHFDKPGCCVRLGDVDPEQTRILLVVEGYATGCTVRMAVEYTLPVFVAMDAGNLAHVVPLLRELYPETRILVLADDDYMTRDRNTGAQTNPGRTAAKSIARKVDACDLLWPIFKPETRGPKDTDFNDLHAREGLEAVRRQISGVLEVMAKHYG